MLARLNAGRLAARRGARPLAATLLSAAVLGGALTACGHPPILERIKQCESGGNYRAVNRSSGAAGGYQFMYTTWRAMPESRGYRNASDAPAWLQDQAARRLYAMYGTSPWAASRSCWGR
ncbi:MAG: transglycosylase family protein [Frankiaceae bacterium]